MPVPVPLPSVKALHALSALAQHGTLTIAASELGVTRSAVSHRIADLEKQLGVALIEKMGRGVRLTEDAETLLAAMGSAIDRIEAAVAPLRRRRMQVRLSTVSTLASHWLIPRLPDFQRRHPNIEIVISTTTRTVDLAEEDVDCAIRHGVGPWPEFVSDVLFRQTLIPVASPAVAERLSRLAGGYDLSAAGLIRARSRFLDWSVWWRESGSAGRPPDGGIIVETSAQALDAALAGAGVAIADMAYIERYVTEGRLIPLAAEPVSLAEGFHFVYRADGPNARTVRALRDWLVETALPRPK